MEQLIKQCAICGAWATKDQAKCFSCGGEDLRDRRMSILLQRTRMIWITTYAFLAGFDCGRGKRFGLILFVIGAFGIWYWVQRMMRYAEVS